MSGPAHDMSRPARDEAVAVDGGAAGDSAGSAGDEETEEAALLGLPPAAPDDRLVYGGHPDQVVDLYRPPATAPVASAMAPVSPGTAPVPSATASASSAEASVPSAGGRIAPLVVLLHGGFWRVAYDRTHLSPAAAALARHGLYVALAEYRRAGGGGGLPETFDDVTHAVRAAAAEVPAGTPVLVAGHSAGGHLALWAAARPGPITAAVALAPVADLARAHDLGLSNGAVAEFLSSGVVAESLGKGAVAESLSTDTRAPRTPAPLTPAALTARIAEADPVRLTPRVPVTLLHGTDDPDVPVELSRRYVAAHGGGTAPVVLRELPGVGHYAAVTPGTDAFAALREALFTAAEAARGAVPESAPESRSGAPEATPEADPGDGQFGRTALTGGESGCTAPDRRAVPGGTVHPWQT
ncbi:alpha/beta hydrolase family protein [Streptomyces sp. CA-132043]|uniref:alpha/beta hydrolase family protein n=1 Tax=Streptomyces sp. CA-132043 TaxID=3240048 RepID=UPI003D8BB9AB